MTNSTYTPSVHLFVDMDGTLVTWKQAACFEELLQENYFRDLPPYKEVVDAMGCVRLKYVLYFLSCVCQTCCNPHGLR